jgi:hypothetical protein
MLTAVFLVGGILLGAATFWLRGSALFEQLTGRGKTTGDFAWAIPMAGFAVLAGFPLADLPGLVMALWLGGRLGWWRSLDMGTQNDTVQRDFLMHSARGFFWTAPAALYMAAASMDAWWGDWAWQGSHPGIIVLALSGLTAGGAWWLGFKLRPPVYQAIHQPDGSIHMHYDAADQKRPWGTEIGELIYGGVIGAALYLAVVL